MKVFISWSGEKSRRVALALREWLPLVINSIEPFVSDEDIHSGSRWQSEVATELEGTNFGILCVTKENQASRWLNFEAGALAKAIEESRVIPLAVDLKPSDIELPLGQFQAQSASEDGVRKILVSLNSAADRPLGDSNLERAASKWWPDLEEQLGEIERTSEASDGDVDTRSERELLEETLDTVRSIARTVSNPPSGVSAAPVQILEKDHPLLAELSELVKGFDEDAEVRRSLHRRVVRIATNPLPKDLVAEVRDRARVYGATARILQPRFKELWAQRRAAQEDHVSG